MLHITPSERVALQLLAQDTTPDRIAEQLGIHDREIEDYLVTLFARMGVTNRAEAIAAASRRGLLPSDDLVHEPQVIGA